MKGAEPSTMPHPSAAGCPWETCILGTCLLACTPVALGSLPFEGGIGTFFLKSVVAA